MRTQLSGPPHRLTRALVISLAHWSVLGVSVAGAAGPTRLSLEPVASLPGHKDPVTVVAFTAEDSRLVSGGHDGLVQFGDVVRREARLQIKAHARFGGLGVQFLAFSPDGKRMASAGRESDVHVWDAASGERLKTLEASGILLGLAFSGDGRSVAVATESEVAVWDWRAGRRTMRRAASDSLRCSLAFGSGDSQLLTVRGQRESLQASTWEVKTSQVRHRELSHRPQDRLYPPFAVELSRDRSLCAAGFGADLAEFRKDFEDKLKRGVARLHGERAGSGVGSRQRASLEVDGRQAGPGRD